MSRPISKCVDDFPDFILDGFLDLKRACGRWPQVLLIGGMLADMMNVRPGVWRSYHLTPGIWHWDSWLEPDLCPGLDEFGESDTWPE